MKTFLLKSSIAVICLCMANNALASNSIKLYSADNVIPFNILHTHQLPELKLSPQQISQKPLTKVAQVCWIMDTGDCLGLDFVGTDIGGPDGTKPDEYTPKGPEDCINEGYTMTQCPEGQEPTKVCMYDDRYFAGCVPSCPDDYKICEEPYYGIGEECNGKYKECQCDYCVGYDYKEEDIPNGYVADGEPCSSCNGPRYKIKPNPCDGYMECEREPAKNATTCLSGDKLLYSDCNDCDSECPAGTTESNPGGCGGSTTNECGDKTCYYPYEACCTDECPSYTKSSSSGCTYGATSCYDSCYGKTWYKCNDAPKDPCEGVSCPTAKSCAYGCASYSSSTSCCSSVCTSCNSKPYDPCEGVSGISCSSGYHCSSYGSCGQCTGCSKDIIEDPCAGVSCPTAKTCSYGCASYSSATSCCSSVCTSCKSDPCESVTSVRCGSNETCSTYGSCGECLACKSVDPCAGVSCPVAKTCDYGCASFSSSTSCCSSVCTSCKSNPCAGVTGVSCGRNQTCSSYGSCGECTACKTELTRPTDSCPGGAPGSPCSCGGTHSGIGPARAHFCTASHW